MIEIRISEWAFGVGLNLADLVSGVILSYANALVRMPEY